MGDETPKEPILRPEEPSPEHASRYKPSNWSKNTLISGIILLVALFGGLVYALVHHNNNNGDQAAQSTNPEVLTATVGGQAEISNDGKIWNSVKAGNQVAAGSYIRSLEASRSIVVFSDRSLVRLDSGTSIRIDSLSSADVTMTLLGGHLYAKSVDKAFRIHLQVQKSVISSKAAGYQAYVASGKTVVQTYSGTTQIDTQGDTQTTSIVIGEGESLIGENSGKLRLSTLQGDAFLLWNIERDKHNPNFKSHLGFLSKLSAVNTNHPATVSPGFTLSGLQRSDGSIVLSWPKAYAHLGLSWNRSSSSYSDQHLLDVSGKTSFTWNYPDGKTIWFRLCSPIENTDATSSGLECVSISKDFKLSNPVSFKPPLIKSRVVESGGRIQLTHDSNILKWTYGGTAPLGFVVIATSEIDDSAKTNATTYDINGFSKSYEYFYVCKQGYHELVDCSTEIKVNRS